MKAKLLRKLRDIGEKQINIFSVTTTNGLITGLSYGHNEDLYKDLFDLGDSELDVKNKAANIYINSNINRIRNKYKKYSRNKNNI